MDLKTGKKRIYFIAAAVMVAVVGLAAPLPAAEEKADIRKSRDAGAQSVKPVEEEKPTGEFAVSALSQYIWRGYEMSRNSIVIQPSITVGYKGFSAGVWGNLDTKPYYSGTDVDKGYSSAWNETDFTLSYSRAIGLFNIGAGYIYYGLGSLNRDAPDRADAQELFVTVGLSTLLSPTLTVFKEIDHYRNWYFLLAVSHTFEINKYVGLKLAASASYLKSEYADAALFNAGAGYGGYPKFDGECRATDDKFSDFHDGTISVSLPIRPVKHITVTPVLSYTFPLSQNARYEMKGQGWKGVADNTDRDSTFLYGGVSASLSF